MLTPFAYSIISATVLSLVSQESKSVTISTQISHVRAFRGEGEEEAARRRHKRKKRT